MAAYGRGNLEDRAVHYYNAGRLFAGQNAVHQLRMAEPAWMHKLNPDQRSRTQSRLKGYANTAIPDSILHLLCATTPANAPPVSLDKPVRNAFLLLFLLALGWLVAATLGHPIDALLLTACLMLAAFGFVLNALAPAADPSMSFLIDDPRGMASLMILASFACFARGRVLLAILSLLLAAGCHAGLAVVTVPCALLSFGLTLCDRADSRYIRFLLALLVVLSSLFLSRYMAGSLFHPQVCIPAGFIILFLLAGFEASHPGLRASASLAAFLFLTLVVGVTVQHPPVLKWLIKVTGNNLIEELPTRLTAVRHLVSLALPLAAVLGLMDRFLPDLFPNRIRQQVLLSLASLGLVWALAAGQVPWTKARQDMAAFFQAGESAAARTAPSSRDLPSLDPRHEAAFFTALGDYLLSNPRPEPN
jgi:hypothetical protein